MAANPGVERRQYERAIFGLIAILFPMIVLIGFSRTYYLKQFFPAPPIPSTLVHIHGLAMTLWIVLFVVQTWMIRTKRVALHMKLGWFGAALAAVIVVSGFLTGVAAAKFGSNATPPGFPPLGFLVVPFFDVVLFSLFFGGAVYFRKRPAEHKRLILLTALNFLPPAIGRFPFEFVLSAGPLVFLGVPTLLAIAFLIYDRWRIGSFNKVYLAGAILLIVSYPARLALSGTELWMTFAAWLTSWAA
ncbi:MAG: hypothetical protein IPN69_22120 [Acidobacteria bacterium]|nr:hypothetical protein [Acidobacteriota bacterium]MBK8813404.1 hypothetical protein [Acidobacteriota bacterium]